MKKNLKIYKYKLLLILIILSSCGTDRDRKEENKEEAHQVNLIQNHDQFKFLISNKIHISKDQFLVMIELIKTLYKQQFSELGVELLIHPDWESDLEGTFEFRAQHQWGFSIYGGLARAKEMTSDALLLAMCHELGHLLGGPPFKHNSLSVEGQADYFATSSCFTKIWNSLLPNKEVPF